MKDAEGNNLSIGDEVIFNASGTLVRGKVVDLSSKYVYVEYSRWVYSDHSSPFTHAERRFECYNGKTNHTNSVIKILGHNLPTIKYSENYVDADSYC